jgi:hypothetical protein
MKKAERLHAKQDDQFTKETDYVSTQCIKNRHDRLPITPHVTLARVLMNWRLAKEPGTWFFLHVEQSYEETTLYFHSTIGDKVSQLVHFKPIIMDFEYGPRAWNGFDKSAKDFLGGSMSMTLTLIA